VKRRRYLSVIALVMLLAALFSTETAEVWCRVAVGATAEVDDDDGPYFTCRSDGGRAHFGGPPARPIETARQDLGYAQETATASTANIVDVPTFSLPQLDVIVPPAIFGPIVVPASTVFCTPETRGPPIRAGRFVRPPPRAPPVS